MADTCIRLLNIHRACIPAVAMNHYVKWRATINAPITLIYYQSWSMGGLEPGCFLSWKVLKFLRNLELTKKRRLSVAAIWTHWTLFRQMWGLKAVLGKCFAFQRETSTIQFIFLLKETSLQCELLFYFKPPFKMITQHPSLYFHSATLVHQAP